MYRRGKKYKVHRPKIDVNTHWQKNTYRKEQETKERKKECKNLQFHQRGNLGIGGFINPALLATKAGLVP
jgi:hypothetical protein